MPSPQKFTWRLPALVGRHACLRGLTVASTPRNNANKRLYLLGGILLLWAGAICLRLVYLQIFRYGDFESRAQHQQQRTTEVAAKRGIIYDRAGRELAMSIAVDSVFAVPAEIPDLAGNNIPDCANHQSRSPGAAGQVPGSSHFLLGGAQGRCRNRGPHPVPESAAAFISRKNPSGSIPSAIWRRRSSVTWAWTTKD